MMKIRLLCTEKDRAPLRPILDALAKKGVSVAEDGAVTLCALSENSYQDEGCVNAFLRLVAEGAALVPLQLDEAPIPEALMNAIFSRNVIIAPGRSAEQIAERVADALPRKKSRLPLLLGLAGVAVLAVIALLVVNGSKQPKEEAAPVSASAPVNVDLPEGLTAEDLAKILDVVIVGEEVRFYTQEDLPEDGSLPDWSDFSSRDEDWMEDGNVTWRFDRGHFSTEGDTAHWYSHEDGHEYSETSHDLRYLEHMPNLQSLSLSLVASDALPELRKLGKLETLQLNACRISDLDWVAGSSLRELSISNNTGSLTDFNALTECGELRRFSLNLIDVSEADLSAFAPPALEEVEFTSFDALKGTDLSSLRGCKNLKSVTLYNADVADLDFLADAGELQTLEIKGLHSLRDITVLRELHALRSLTIHDCNAIGNYDPIGECSELQLFSLLVSSETTFQNADFLGRLPKIEDISLIYVYLEDVNFLREIGRRGTPLSLHVQGKIYDWSALSAVKNYASLRIVPVGGSLEDVAPHWQDVTAEDFYTQEITALDLSDLPTVTGTVALRDCALHDLSTMPADWTAKSLQLVDCRNLRSLDGLQNQTVIGRGQGNLELRGCEHMYDWSALDGTAFDDLIISRCYTLPEGQHWKAGFMGVADVPGITDLAFLEGLDADSPCDISLVGLDVQNISPLGRFHGDTLTVSPELEEQAEDLVKAGNFKEYAIDYPNTGWERNTEGITLLSLDELTELPPALLRRVGRVTLAGDQIVDMEQGDVWQDYSNWRGGNDLDLIYYNYLDGSMTPLGDGIMTDFSLLAPLTGLKTLELYDQPLATLDGIQSFAELRRVQLGYTSAIRDISAVFACPELETLLLSGTGVESIQGVQNLEYLTELDISDTRVQDISPLGELGYTDAMAKNGGFRLNLNGTSVTDYSPLSALGVLSALSINGADAALWVPCVADTEIHQLSAQGCFTSGDANALFAEFVRTHPGLTELVLYDNTGITDLTPLLSLPALEYVYVTSNMTQAVASLDGAELSFSFHAF